MQKKHRRARPRLITCRELFHFLDDHLDGSLPRAQRTEFARHLAVCPPCVRYIANYQAAIRLGKAAYARADEPVPRRVPEALVKAILAARGKGKGGRSGS